MISGPQGELFEVVIDRLSLGGDGIGKVAGKVVFVPFSAPNDRLLIRIVENRKQYARGEIVKILSPASGRTNPKCEYFGKCGGCNWQHLSYETQLEWKEKILLEQLQKSWDTPIEIAPIISSPQAFKYRNRIRLQKQNGRFGYFARGTHDFVEINSCAIAEDSAWTQSTEDVNTDSDFTFSQVNTAQNENLIRLIADIAKEIQPDRIYDFYAGSGNFSLPLSRQIKVPIIAVESNLESVELAKRRLQNDNISPKHLEFYLATTDQYLKRSLIEKNALVILDPPRGGCSEDVIHSLVHQCFQHLAYISCNPASLSRDLGLLRQSLGNQVKIRKIQPLDMFPQTDHVECLVHLIIDR